MSIRVEAGRCPQNHRCPAMRICPVDAISQNGNDAPLIDEEKCIDCGKCAKMCPYGVFQQN
jgi:ferredoxin